MDLKLMFFNVWVRCYSYNNKFILRNRRRRKQSRLRLAYDAVLAIMLPWFLLRWGALAAYEAAFGKARVHRLMERERSQTFAHEMGMVAIAKNEGPYIREWIEYHKLVGFTIFYIYDNDSTDNTKAAAAALHRARRSCLHTLPRHSPAARCLQRRCGEAQGRVPLDGFHRP